MNSRQAVLCAYMRNYMRIYTIQAARILPLPCAGVDSRAGMELRRALAEGLGVSLPVTLLYDRQSVSEIVSYIEEHVSTHAAAAGAQVSRPEGTTLSVKYCAWPCRLV